MPPREAQERSKRAQEKPRRGKGRQEAEHPRRGPGGAQESPRRAPGEAQRGPGRRGKDKRRQEQTRPAAGRDNKLTKGLPEPLSPELLGPYPTYCSCI